MNYKIHFVTEIGDDIFITNCGLLYSDMYDFETLDITKIKSKITCKNCLRCKPKLEVK